MKNHKKNNVIELSDFQLFAAIAFFVVLINAWFWIWFFVS